MKMISVLDETDMKIIELLSQGDQPRDIAHKLWMRGGTVRQRLFRLRLHFRCYSNSQLIEYFYRQESA